MWNFAYNIKIYPFHGLQCFVIDIVKSMTPGWEILFFNFAINLISNLASLFIPGMSLTYKRWAFLSRSQLI